MGSDPSRKGPLSSGSAFLLHFQPCCNCTPRAALQRLLCTRAQEAPFACWTNRQPFLQGSCGNGGCVGVDHCARFSACTCMYRSTVHFFKRGIAPVACKRAVYLSMAPLSLLGTVIRDKMMKTVTVQVNARCNMNNF